MRHFFIVASVTVLALPATAVLPQARGRHIATPPVPPAIKVEAGHKPFLVGRAVGTQNYVCLPSSSGFGWALFGPQATLFDDNDRQRLTHFLSANPDEAGVLRATWQHSSDTSRVWARAISSSSDPAFVGPGAIPWLLLEVAGTEDGPTGGSKLTATTFIQRLNTAGGTAPSTGCSTSTDVGRRTDVPYTADYFFYRDRDRDDDS